MAETNEADRGTNGQETGVPTLRRKLFATLDSITQKFQGLLSWRRLVASIITIALMAVVVIFTATLTLGRSGDDTPYVFGSVIPTNKWANFYSLESTLDRQPLPVGAVITARDPQGVVCGEFLVTEAGRYGLMPVYGDDPLTEVDEGAVPGDRLEFRINGIQATVTGLYDPIWTAMGDLKQVNLAASTQ